MKKVIAIFIVTIFGGLIRLYPALSASFPIFDGGLFYVMAKEIQASLFNLPYYTSYNGGMIPFVYPPFGHYLLVLSAWITHSSLLTMMRLLPAIISILTVPAFFLLAKSLVMEWSTAFIAACVFAVLTPAYDWLIMGGSITRAPGFLFALLTLNQVVLVYQNAGKGHVVLAALFASLTVLSHPGMAWFTLYSSVLFFAFAKSRRRNLENSLVIAISVVLLTAPWWLNIINRFGSAPLVNALNTGTGSISGWTFFLPLLFKFTNEPLLDLYAVLGLLGILVAFRDRRMMLVVWFLLIFFMQTIESAVVASIPFAIFVGLGINKLVLPGLASIGSNGNFTADWKPNLAQGIFLVYLIVVGLASANMASSSMVPISQSDIETMDWVKKNTSLNSRFAILVGENAANINILEWFPALSERKSINTTQGMEWVPVESGKNDLATLARLQTCTIQTVACLEEWSGQTGQIWDYLYLPLKAAILSDGSTSRLFDSLRASRSYDLVFQNASTYVFERIVR